VDHPPHSLAVMLSLVNANIDTELVTVKTKKSSSESSRLSRNSHDDANAEQVCNCFDTRCFILCYFTSLMYW